MKVGDKTIIRASAQSWGDFSPQATHFYGVLENTEDTWSHTLDARGSEAEALEDAVEEYFKRFDHKKYILVVGASQGDMCLDWE